MSVSDEYLCFVLEQLAGAQRVSCKRMFGGVGLYRDQVFFAILSEDTLYFKVDDASRCDYQSRGMQPFRPYADRPQVSMSYYEVPAEVLEDRDECVAWALRAVAANAARTRARSKQKPRRARR